MKTVIFDVDGTLLSTESMYMHSLQKTMAEIGMPKTYEEVYKTFGLPSLDALTYLEVPNALEVQKQWQGHYHDFWDEVTLFDGVAALLAELRLVVSDLGIVTSNTPEEFADHADEFHINQYFDDFVFAGQTPNMKPAPDPILKAVADLGAQKQSAIYIGDSVHDMHAAHAAGIAFGMAGWGVRDRTIFGDEPEFVFYKPADVLAVVTQ
jgi:HAD superfamily hydrolase (TIGR01549 family)